MPVAPIAQTEELSTRVLSQLTLFKDEVIASDMLEYLPETSIAHHKPFYQTAIDFYRVHARYPDETLLCNAHPHFTPNPDPVTLDVVDALKYRIRVEYTQALAMQAVGKGNFDEVQKLCAALEPIRTRAFYSIDDAFAEYKEMTTRPRGIQTGIPEVDEVLKACSYGTMTVIGAPPSQFKTTTGISIAYGAMIAGFNVCILSFELMPRDVYFNFLSRHSYEMGTPLDAERIKKALESDEALPILENVIKSFKEIRGQLVVLTQADFADLRNASIYATLRKVDEQMTANACEEGTEGAPNGHPPGLDVVVNDYAQRMAVYRPPNEAETEFLNSRVSFFNTLAITFMGRGLIVFMLAQVQRAGEIELSKKKKAKSTMLAGVNALDRDAHAILILHSDQSMRLSNTLLVQVVKNRSGRVMDDMVNVKVDPQHYIVGFSSGENPSVEEFADMVADPDALFST